MYGILDDELPFSTLAGDVSKAAFVTERSKSPLLSSILRHASTAVGVRHSIVKE